MHRRQLLLAVALWSLAGPALARPVTERVARDLQRQGFTSVEITRTLLGRDRVVATGPDGRREVIVNPRTGEILRDLWTPSGSGQAGSGLISTDDDDGGGQGRGRGRGRGGDDGNDDSGGDDSGGDDGGGGDDSGGDD
jgi:hypothetical protein